MFLCNKNMTFYVHFMYVVLIFHFWTFYYIKHVLFIFHSCKNAFLPQLIFDRIVLRTMAASHGCVAANTFLHQIHFCIKCIFASGTIFALQSMALRTIAAGHASFGRLCCVAKIYFCIKYIFAQPPWLQKCFFATP